MLALPLLALLSLAVGPRAFSDESAYAPLWLYQGTWQSRTTGREKIDRIANQCKIVGTYFACQQSVNEKLASLIVFVPRETPGAYYVQGVLPDGRAAGRAELNIDGDHWTYQSSDQEGGKTTFYRTTNLFTGKNRIHFEQSESPDGQHWMITGSGDESRLGAAEP